MRAWWRWSRDVDVRVTSRSIVALLWFVAMTAGCGDKETLAPSPPAPFAVSAISPTAGLPGQTVSVTGSGFLPGAILTFGETQASSQVVTSTRISATVPTLPAAIVDIVVINPDGQRGTLAAAFSIEIVPSDSQTVSLTVNPRIVAPGGDLSVDWAVSVNHSSADWIGFFGIGVPSTSYQDGYWQYVGNGLSGTLMFKAPLQSGEYEFRYLLDDGYIDVARAPVTVR
jgi:hypothetical protein